MLRRDFVMKIQIHAEPETDHPGCDVSYQRVDGKSSIEIEGRMFPGELRLLSEAVSLIEHRIRRGFNDQGE